MDIIQAVKEAQKKNVGIRNDICKRCNNYLLPTNTDECFLLIPIGCKVADETLRIAPRWNPTINDIVKNDWELFCGDYSIMAED